MAFLDVIEWWNSKIYYVLTMNRGFITVKRIIRGRMYQRQVSSTGCLTPPEAAAFLDLGLRHVYRLLECKELPSWNRNGRVLIPCEAVIKRMEIKTLKGGVFLMPTKRQLERRVAELEDFFEESQTLSDRAFGRDEGCDEEEGEDE
jgi:excisionase family DNA binding protein